MQIERTKNEIIVRLQPDMDILVLQRVIEYLRFKEATKNSVASDDDVNPLADESKKRWWAENKHRFLP